MQIRFQWSFRYNFDQFLSITKHLTVLEMIYKPIFVAIKRE